MSRQNFQDLPKTVPVMVLPGATLFPNALLPLFIFEPRYRSMLEEALGRNRILAVAMPRDEEESELHPIAGIGLLRACIRNDDGTSNLILQGVGRVRFSGWEQLEPFRMARIDHLETIGEEDETLAMQVTRLHALCARFKEQGIELPEQFEAYLGQISNIGAITDLVASTLVADSSVRQQLLEELEISKRLSLLLAALTKQLA